MVEYAGNRAAARARRAARAEATSLARRLDWVLVATVGGLVAYGLWAIAGITRHDVPGSPSYYVTRQAIFAAVGSWSIRACTDATTARSTPGRSR